MGTAADLGILRILNGRFFQRLTTLAPTWADAISWLVPTDQKEETYRWLNGVPGMREWVHGREPKQLLTKGVKVINRKFESTIEIDSDDLRRDKLGQLNIRIDELAQVAGGDHWHEMLSAIIATPGTAYDGIAYYSDSHVEDSSGAQSNIHSEDVTDTAAPTIPEMEKAILNGVSKLHAILDGQKRPINAAARQFVVMVPQALWKIAAQALTLRVILEGGQSRDNTLTNLPGYRFALEPNPRLASAVKFYIFVADTPRKAFLRQQEGQVRQATKDETFDNHKWLFGVESDREVAAAYWQSALEVTLT